PRHLWRLIWFTLPTVIIQTHILRTSMYGLIAFTYLRVVCCVHQSPRPGGADDHACPDDAAARVRRRPAADAARPRRPHPAAARLRDPGRVVRRLHGGAAAAVA